MIKKLTLTGCLSIVFALSACDSDSDDNDSSKIVEKSIDISYMAHAGSTHLSCGVTMSNLGTTNLEGKMSDLRLYINDISLVSDEADEYEVTLTESDWQTENVALLDFIDKENCLEASGETRETNTKIAGTYNAPANAIITGIKFGVGVPFELNHENPTEAASPLNISAMQWNWQGGYKHMRIEAEINQQAYLFHLGSTGCDGNPLSGETTACTYANRPEITLENFDPDMSAIQIDLQELLKDTALDTGGSCHSNSGQAAICTGGFDNLGLDFYDDVGVVEQSTPGQSVFTAVMNHE